ncbi:putative transporter [Pantoea agglomerans]|uniref:Putative transporter n=1 Tax=Enterobacter agglomerans TaxID=549 RepID=A0A379AHQ2_ENTAG|nr:putative transporter [Pantoea agglomerans]
MLSNKGFMPYLALLSMLGFLATDMYLARLWCDAANL